MRRIWLPAFLLGVAGFDPVGAFTFLGAAALGARRRMLAVLSVVSVGVTALESIVASVALGALLRGSHRAVPHPGHREVSWALLVGSILLLGWGVWRLLHPIGEPSTDPDAHSRAPRSLGTAGMALSGLLVGLSSLIDPAWYAMVAFASSLREPVAAVVVSVIWTLLSHCVLVVLALSLLTPGFHRVESFIAQARTRWRRPIWWGLTALLLGAGLAGVAMALVRMLHP